MKKYIALLLFASVGFSQPRQTVNNADITGVNHVKSGASLIADPGAILTGFPGTGSVTSVAISLPAFLAVTGSPITTSGTFAITYSGTPLPKANGGTGLTNPSLVEGSGITITGSWPNQTINATAGGGGTVTAVTVTPANGVSATVTNQGTTPALTVSLGAITPTTVNGQTITTGTGTLTLASHTVTAAGDATISGTSSGTNTGDQTITLTGDATGSGTGSFAINVGRINGTALSGLATGLLKNTTSSGVPSIAASGTDYVIPSGNVATATALQASRTINGVSFNGTANIIVPAAANTLTGTTLASNITASSMLSAAGGSFGTAAFTSSSSYEIPLNFIAPLSRSANNISVGAAAADGSTQGVASFSSSDFNSSGGDITIDYTNAQAAGAGTKGFLTSTDWSTFNGKENVLTFTGGLSRTTNTVIIADTAVTPGIYTNPTITISQKGQITLASNGSASGVTSVAATAPSFLSVSGSPITTSGTLAFTYSGTAIPVTSGGTGVTSMTSNSVVLGNGTGAVNFVAPGTTGNALISNGTTWTSTALTGGGNALTSNPLSQFAATTSSQFAGVISDETGSGLVVLGTSPTFTTQITAPKIVYSGSIIETSGSGTPEGSVTAAVGSVFHRSDGGSSTTLYVKESGSGNSGWVGVGSGGGGTIPVTQGGTGLTTLTANNVILGNGTSNPTFVAPGSTGNALISNGTTWTSQALSGGGNALTSNPLSQFASTTSSQFAGVISDETGTGAVVLGTSPTFTTQATIPKIVYTGSVIETSGTGSPESAVTADVGSVFHRTDGGSATTLYVKESGSGNTGWVASGGGGGSGTVNSGTTGHLAYYASSGNAVSDLTPSPNTVLVGSGSSTVSFTSTLPSITVGGDFFILNGASTTFHGDGGGGLVVTSGGSGNNLQFVPGGTGDFAVGDIAHNVRIAFYSGTGNSGFNQFYNGNGALKWQVGKQTDNTYIINDAVAGNNAMVLTTGGLFQFAPSGGRVLVGTSTDDGSNRLQVNGTATFSTSIVSPKIVYTGSVIEVTGTGDPETVVTAAVGSVFHRTDGGSGTTLYVKESGAGNTGWVAIAGLGGSSGSTDNAIIRADGTGGSTVQSSLVTVDDSGGITAPGQVKALNFRGGIYWVDGGYIRSNKTTITPTYGAAAGTSPSSTITGSSVAGQVSVTTGSSVTLGGTLVEIPFPDDYGISTDVAVCLTPTNSNAAQVSTAIYVTVIHTPSFSRWQINVSAASPLTSATTYTWNYMAASQE